jgi:hypothetical protein
MNENNLNIKIGDMIQSDTGACGIVVRLPNTEKPAINNHYIMNWNKGEPKEWGTDPETMKHLIEFGKWKVIPL